MVRNDVPWQEVRWRYERGEGTFRSLAGEYGVSRSTLERRAMQEHWGGRRRNTGERTGECLHSAVQQLLQCVEERLLQPEEPADVRTLKELTGVLRELMQLRRSLAEEEQSAAAAPALRVVLEGEVEEWSR